MTKRSTPSATPNPPSGRRNSVASWTIPKPADVISYSYLWSHEAARGEESGRKDRPVVVVISAIIRGDRTRLLVAPITHSKPESGVDAIEIPVNVKRQLGLDHQQSWIVLSELNRFIWPGPDVRSAPGRDSPLYDAIPDWLFRRVRDSIVRNATANTLAVTKRTE